MFHSIFTLTLLILPVLISSQVDDKYRPKFHFSIASNWINDPNGMVYLDGEYHLHYQYHPNDTVWGPMHWGHSVSRNLITWTDLPIALYPDPLGTIFSGSAVVDFSNSTGFQDSSDTLPIIAIFTHAGDTQQQSIAYSLDKARTFTKFQGNPVIPNPGIVDFRDPKVIQFNNRWILLLAAGNKIMFYSSIDLKSWTYLSEFGADPEQGSHSGVWECPDLFPLEFGGETVWILIVSINPGGPNGGSVTQYFVGTFDGERFISPQMNPLWMDWGVDNYAAVAFFNEPFNRTIMMGWMNNWEYANILPTVGWRGQMTLPREMGLTLINGQIRLTSKFPQEVQALHKQDDVHQLFPNQVLLADEVINVPTMNNTLLRTVLVFDMTNMTNGASIAICFMNNLGQEVCTGYDKGRQVFPIFVDRERSGKVDFGSFSKRAVAARELVTSSIKFEILLDESAVEVLIDEGVTCLTALFYPDQPYTLMQIRHHANGNLESRLVISAGEVRGLYSKDEIM